jgi:hypothetical protein
VVTHKYVLLDSLYLPGLLVISYTGNGSFFSLVYLSSSLWSGLLRCLAASFFVVAGPLLAGAVVNLGT